MTRFAAAMFIALPIAAIALYTVLHQIYPRTPGPRPELALHLLTHGPAALAALWGHLMTYGIAGLVTGVLFQPLGYPSALAYGAAAGAVAVLGIALVTAPPPERRWLLALLVSAVAPYALIAVARINVPGVSQIGYHVWASQGRYHYAASIALAVALCMAAKRWISFLPAGAALPEPLKSGAVVAGAALLLALYARSDWRFDLHPGTRAEVGAVLAEATDAVRAVPQGQTAYVADRWFTVHYHGPKTLSYAAIFSLFHAGNELEGRRLFYVQDDLHYLRSIPPNSRLSRLVVPPPRQAKTPP
jgi:hypothetical protein